MNVQPVVRYRPPTYATYDYFLSHPELLSKVPQCWRNNAAVLTAAGLFAMMTSGCDLFENFFTTGGPPRFMPSVTEMEAQEYIRDKAANAGIHFLPNALTIHNFQMPIHIVPDTVHTDTVYYMSAADFIFDEYDSTRHIAYEYLSSEDLDALTTQDSTLRNRSFNWYQTAVDLQNALREQHPELHSGVAHESINEEYVRMQVNDFILWLRSQGIL